LFVGAYAQELTGTYPALAFPLGYAGQGDAPHAAYASPALAARSASVNQFHPYRR